MNEKPILFSRPMVLALLAGTKTQTRRAITSRSPEMTALLVNLNAGIRVEETKAELIRCNSPYGQPGDLIWVRENWTPLPRFMKDGSTKFPVTYHANQSEGSLKMLFDCGIKWRPSIHLKKIYSRIWLRVLDVRIERLLDISEQDAIAEGVERWPSDIKNMGDKFLYRYQSYKTPVPNGSQESPYFAATQSFIELWETINEDLTNTNPWVWVVEFKVVSTTGRPVVKESEVANA